MGKSLTEFKKGVTEAQNEVTKTIDEDISPIEEAEAEEAKDA
jgi:Sec-independent protein translocase protein TatA